jgi:2-amino-4-hydroxy-6-hydroxymethyldihydropteridine diphosphokinase
LIEPAQVFAGIGGNVGDTAHTLSAAVARIERESSVRVLASSPVYRNPPVGPQDQPDYLNAVIELEVLLSPQDLLSLFLAVEMEFGRVRAIRWGPRTLDLDILTYGDRIVDEPGLTIPHPHMHERPFVLVPLADLNPHAVHPVLNQSYCDMAEHVGREGLDRVDVSLFSAKNRDEV